jgi:ABC-2 type transport system ATP-binding protein
MATLTDAPSPSRQPHPYAIEARELTKRFDSHVALSGLNLQVPAGQVVCLLGPNGAGKTTTINLFMGFLAPSSGVALVDGVDASKNAVQARRRLAYIPETVSLYGNLSGLENLEYFAGLGGVSDLSRPRLEQLLERAGLQRQAFDRRASTYSKGMRQKVCVALALAKEAAALLLDEPTSGLDPYAANEFSSLVTSLAGEGVAALMATHDLLLARQCGDQIIIMVDGQVRQSLRSADLTVGELEEVYLRELRNVSSHEEAR